MIEQYPHQYSQANQTNRDSASKSPLRTPLVRIPRLAWNGLVMAPFYRMNPPPEVHSGSRKYREDLPDTSFSIPRGASNKDGTCDASMDLFVVSIRRGRSDFK